MRKKFFLTMRLSIFMTSWLLWILPPHAIAQQSMAPLNPDFLQYQKSQTGYLPSPLNLSHLTGQPLFQISEQVDLPSSYDLRSQGRLTPVRDQGDCSSDWAFATYGSLESCLLPSEAWDFSENNLKNTHGFDLGHCDGGNANMSIAYLARWTGPVSEAEDPYTTSSSKAFPSELGVRKHIQEVLLIPNRASPLDNENIKQAIMTCGAVYTSMYFRNNYYSIVHKTYYYYGTFPSNHSVAIVGWDDDFDRHRFSIDAPGDGAFIIKNSWGTDWGESGYFYVSYYDSRIGRENYVFSNAEPTTNYQRIYQYDPLGWVRSFGYGSNTAWFANAFTALADERLEAVSFYVASPNSSYEIYVYLNANSGPTSGSLSGSQAGLIPFPGYHTIDLANPPVLALNQKFSVVVKLTTPGYDYPVPIESPQAGYSSQATANPGESYLSSDGVSWNDITTSVENANVCLKAFTIEMSPPQTVITSGVIGSNNATFTYTGTDDITPTAGLLYATYLQGYDSGWSSFSSSASKSYTNLPDGSYIFQVKAKDEAGNEDPTPATQSFTILLPPEPAGLISPSGPVTTIAPTFTWNAVSKATEYLLCVNHSGGQFSQLFTASAANCATGKGACSVTLPFTLPVGEGEWKIQTKNEGGCGPWSSAMSFAVPPPGSATLLSPSGAISNRKPTYSWNAVSLAAEYYLWVNDSTGTRIQEWYTAAAVGCASGITTCSVTPEVVLNLGAGQWRIQTKNQGVTGPLGDAMLFTVVEMISTPNTPRGPTNGITGTPFSYTVDGSTSNVGDSMQYFFDWGDGTNSGWLPAGTTSASKSWALSGTYPVKAQARCATHTSEVSSWSAILSVGIEVVSTPTTPSGPTTGTPGISYSYSTGGASSNLGHSVQYFFDWGDGTNSGWLSAGTTSASKSWASGGTYMVRAQARCATDTSAVSGWSGTLPVSIETISPPSPASGPTGGLPGTNYTYSTGGSSSNVKHSIQYLFDWGDGTDSGWLPVGTNAVSHSWTSNGNFSIKVRARCSQHASIISYWSEAFTVSIETVSKPKKPSGPTLGAIDTSYDFSTGGSTTSMGHATQYLFDWGDGSNSGWLPVGTTSTSHAYASAGTYSIKTQSRCAQHTLVASSWSPSLSFGVEAISQPTVLRGPSFGTFNTIYTYTVDGASSNFGHSVQYLFDWGDGSNSGWLPVGTSSASKSWALGGTYLIRVQARCATHTSTLSTWSESHSVVIETVSTPNAPTGPGIGHPEVTLAFSTGGCSSNLGHSVQYLFDWGDGTNSDWLPVGATSASHSWKLPGPYLVKAQARCAIHTSIASSWSEAFAVKISIIILQSPSSNTIFESCTLITNCQPAFSWTPKGTYTGYKILFSISPIDFKTRGVKVAAGTARGTSNSWKPSSSSWKAIMKSSNNNGIIRPIYWKVVGTKSDRTTVESEVRSFSIGLPEAGTIKAPLDGAFFDPATSPTFDFDTNCNTKFRLEISSLSDFSVSTKVKAFNFTVSNPNLVTSLQKTLSSSQWNGVKKLIGTGTGYFRIKAWDGVNRLTISEVGSFMIQ